MLLATRLNTFTHTHTRTHTHTHARIQSHTYSNLSHCQRVSIDWLIDFFFSSATVSSNTDQEWHTQSHIYSDQRNLCLSMACWCIFDLCKPSPLHITHTYSHVYLETCYVKITLTMSLSTLSFTWKWVHCFLLLVGFDLALWYGRPITAVMFPLYVALHWHK